MSVIDDPLRLFDLTGRVAIVTGASSGLGEAIARSLAAVGARVAVVARRRERLAALAEDIGGRPYACDLTEPDQLEGLVAGVAEELGSPEILVNAAGAIAEVRAAEDESADAIARTFALNLTAPFRLSQLVFPHMRQIGRGSILNVSSISGRVGVPGIPQASYAASKSGLSGLTAELAVQWARHAIRVNTLAPGFFRSEITEGMYTEERTHQWLQRNTPLPGDGSVEHHLGAVLWLVSDAGRYTTGQTVVVDGGWTAR